MKKRYLPLILVLVALVTAAFPAYAQQQQLPECPVFASQSAEIRTSYYMGEGVAYMNTGQYNSAVVSFTCVAEVINTSYMPAFMARAAAQTQRRDYEAAIRDYTSAIALNGSLAAAYNNRGIVYAAVQDYEKAEADFDRALELDSDFITAYNNRSVLHTLAGEYDEAIALLERAISITGIEGVLSRLRDPNRAADAQPIPYDRLHARAYALLGIVYEAQALDNYRKYIFLTQGGDGRIQSAAGALESRFTFELRLDDGTWLLTAAFSPTGN